MHLFVMKFQIPNTKIYEFNLALGRLVKWPVYVLHDNEGTTNYKDFKLIRSWENKALMKKDFDSAEYQNLMGAIKVLGEIKTSHVYDTIEDTSLLQEN